MEDGAIQNAGLEAPPPTAPYDVAGASRFFSYPKGAVRWDRCVHPVTPSTGVQNPYPRFTPDWLRVCESGAVAGQPLGTGR